MSWEIEYEEVDKAEGVHRFGLIHRGVITRDGEFARAKHHIALGVGVDGQSCPHCHAPIETGMKLHDDGGIRDTEGKELTPREEIRKRIAQLDEFHGRMDAYVRRHNLKVYKGPQK